MREVSLMHNDFAELSSKILSQGGSFRFKAHGFSMYPIIRNEDVISVHPVEFSALHSGDVVLYYGDKKHLVAHRIVGKQLRNGRIFLRMRGDAAYSPDEWVRDEQVMGKVVSIQRGERFIHLNKNFQRLMSFCWIKLSPVSHLFFKIAYMVKRAAQRFLP